MYKKIIIGLSSLIFITYWSVTIFFQLPDNPIKVNFLRENRIFELFLYQKWSFFAPPPTYDERLYYVFKKDNKEISFEVIALLNKAKSDNAPFNGHENNLDYIISNQTHAIGTHLNNFYDSKNKKNTENIEIIWNDFYNTSKGDHNIKTLLNYAKVVDKSNNLDYSEYEICLILTKIDIPKFKDRNDTTFKSQEKTIFKTPFVKII